MELGAAPLFLTRPAIPWRRTSALFKILTVDALSSIVLGNVHSVLQLARDSSHVDVIAAGPEAALPPGNERRDGPPPPRNVQALEQLMGSRSHTAAPRVQVSGAGPGAPTTPLERSHDLLR